MASFTKNAIKAAFVKLLEQKPINQITVKDIVEECGINRNSFYYHYQDIPALIDAIADEQLESLASAKLYNDPIGAFMLAAIEFAEKNRRVIMHVYRYMDRELLELYVMRACSRFVEVYTERAFRNSAVSDSDARLITHMFSCECFGMMIQWLNEGMEPELKVNIERICELHERTVRALIAAAEADGSGNSR